MTRSSIAGILILAMLSVIFLTGCITTVSPTKTTSAAATTTTITTTTTPSEGIDMEWTPSITAGVGDELPSIADVVALVKPSVVAINTEMYVESFFGPYTEEGAGSGWILDESGIIVTNNHVIEGATSITVTLDDGSSYSVANDNVFTDPTNDLAILKIDADNLPALAIGDSGSLRVGDWVVAIGNSLGRGTRATVGIVSQLDVSLQFSDSQSLYNLIDTSAVINPGNSGGPLVNLAGEVVGITSAKIVASGAEATGFAISTEEAAPIIQQLVNNGYVVRPFLGVQGLLTVDESVAAYFRLSIDSGVLVRGVVEGGPAEDAGLKAGDVIVSIGGEDVTTLKELTDILYAAEIGKALPVSYYRNSQEMQTEVYPVESPPPSFN